MTMPMAISLFEEKNGDWTEIGESQWLFENDEIIGIAKSTEGALMTKVKYADFRLTLEFYPDSTINSGVFVRCQDQVLSAADCHEINIWDMHPNQSYRTGAIVSKVTPIAIVHTLNQWNTYKIESIESKTRVWVNDILTAEYDDDKLLTGYIGIQANGSGVIKFRNLRLEGL